MRLFLLCFLMMGVAMAEETVNIADFSGAKATEVKVKVIKGADISVKKGETFKISLESNPSTGYSWRMLGSTGPVEMTVASMDSKAAAPGVVGAPGTQVFEFKATTAGQQVSLVFVYGRAWEGLGTSCYQVKVEVKE